MKNNKLTIGILAHVDAGKTTLSEAMLFSTGSIKKMGRVDHRDAYLDTFELEKTRGITIFSKQAEFSLGKLDITLLDTPGHVDFSAEMERTLQVLDYAVVLISGADGIQGHTVTLWKLLERYQIPAFIFVNKMDQIGIDRDKLLEELKQRFNEECIDFGSDVDWHHTIESVAMSDEYLLNKFIEKDNLNSEDICKSIFDRKVFPVFFGSALRNKGVDKLLDSLEKYVKLKNYSKLFGARVFKISRDEQGNRLTHIKLTGGILKVKDLIYGEKVDQIRVYSGKQYKSCQEIEAGSICSLTGLNNTKPGDGLGFEKSDTKSVIKPVLRYCIQLPDETNVQEMLKNLRILEEEEPQLNIIWNETLAEIYIHVMGEIEIEILKSIILERYGIEVSFDTGSLVYKETIGEAVVGVGHFEPLRHYAEAHLLLEPGEQGSGMIFETNCSVDILSKNWQQLILSHLSERSHIGVLTGSMITDMKISVVAGKGHLKHTEGGDFRQATYRAIRQGLMKAKMVLLEPVYSFRLELPSEYVGRAIADVQRFFGRHDDPVFNMDEAVLIGIAPVTTMMNYALDVNAYTKGEGRLELSIEGYEPCHNSEEIISKINYNPDEDSNNLSSSVFCSKGLGYYVHWDQVENHMHVENNIILNKKEITETLNIKNVNSNIGTKEITEQEVEEIFIKTYGKIKNKSILDAKVVTNSGKISGSQAYSNTEYISKYKGRKNREVRDRYLLVDGYNIIFAWDNLKVLARENLEAARYKLIDILSNYKSQEYDTIIIVFDAYRVKGNEGSKSKQHNIYIVYTKEAETADQYIERLVNTISGEYDVTVATSDMVEQVIIMGKGAKKLSAEGLKAEVDSVNKMLKDKYIMQEQKIKQHIKVKQHTKNKKDKTM